jgi:anaerobic selenocysteine-containing dehydrogenase
MLHKEPDGSYKIPRIIYADAYASEMVAYADLVLPDTTYLERWDCISLLGFAAPLVLTLLGALAGGPLGKLASVLAVLSAMAGVLAERWLFFAEARHTVTLYYGAPAA